MKLALILPWIILAIALSPIALSIQNYFVYSDSPFLNNQYQSVKVENILKEYFNYTKESEIFVLINGSYTHALQEVENSSKYLENYKIITPYMYLNETNRSYFEAISPLISEGISKLEPYLTLYSNFTEERNELIKNLTFFEYQLNVTYKYGKNVSYSPYIIQYEKYLNETHSAQLAGYYTFHDPFIFLFSFNNFTNYTLIQNTLKNFNDYSYLIYKVTGVNLPEQALTDPKEFILEKIEDLAPPPPITINNFHRNNTWLFIIVVPDNESLSNVNDFIQQTNGLVTGHLPIYAQSEYYTSNNLRIIDVVTFILVGILLVILLRALLPIILLILSAVIGIEVAYAFLYIASLSGYQIYYISGLVIPPIVFGITIDYSILFMYRYFEEIKKNTQNPLKKAFRTAGKNAIFSGLSIALGFSSFLLSPSPLLKNIGEALIIASLSALIPATLFNYTALSSIPKKYLSFPRKDIPNPVDARQKYLEKVSNFSIKNKYIIVGIMGILAIMSLGVFLTHTTNVSISEIVPSNSESLNGEHILTKMFNFSLDYIIIKGNPNSSYSEIFSISKMIIDKGGLVFGPASYGRDLSTTPTYLTTMYYSHNYSIIYAYLPYPVFSNNAINLTKELINNHFMVGGSNANRIDIVDNTVSTYYSFTLPLTIILIIIYISIILKSIVVPLRLSITLLVSSTVGVAVMFLVFHSVYWLSPLIVFALLFSLGIDYDMFIILRIKEEDERNEDERILKGIVKSGLVVTAAGLILSGAFFSLMSSDMRFLVEIGFSVGFSILFDTFIVRPIFVPAIMSILKQYNWWPGKERSKESS
ncbi:MMPL family transporter [Acidianus sulfidivorans JP7]|uniref:Antibiotic transporter n=1 Tax=Acidianus sulfidivorans JP7 TaxID=619593 RepID=A0A2U9IQI8_9CREN|nr:MMPL family transporter [Acidianus sulfidivorans]AWR98285.1 MMPL family transporter [Acidianus sulfidivorans JP7]